MKPAVAQLLHNPLLWRGDSKARVEHTVPTGFIELDGELPGGGWPQGSLAELLVDREGIGELRLLVPALAQLSRAGAWVALIAPPHLPYAPAFARAGIEPGRVAVIQADEEKDRWWAAEQVVRSNSAGALLFWPRAINDARLRRLAVAAQDVVTLAFVLARSERASLPSPAALRIRLSATGEKLRLDIIKRRGGVTGRLLLIDVAAALKSGLESDSLCADDRVQANARRSGAGPRSFSPRFNRQYPCGMPPARIWNRALVRADGLARMPGPDPRGRPRRFQARGYNACSPD